MKTVAFTTSGRDLSAELDPRFGRSAGFLLYNLDTSSSTYINNDQGRAAAQGAGIQAAEMIVRAGVDALVTGHCGPKAYRVLEAAGLKVYNCDLPVINQALEALLAGKLQEATVADVAAHW